MESQSSTSSSQKSESGSRAKSQALRETRFVSEWNRPDWVAMGSAVESGLLLGAGFYSVQFMDPPGEYGNFLLLFGLASAGYFAFRLTSRNSTIRVGDAGVAFEQGGELTRLLWSEMKSIRFENQHLVLVGANTTLRLPSQSHTRAIRAVLAEAAERLPKILDVPAKLVDELPVVTGDAPKPEPVEALQIAGKRCLVSKQVLTFERDARLCPVCTSVYHRDHVPEQCLTCDRPLGKRAIALPG